MDRRHGRGAEGAASFGRPRRYVDPALADEATGDLAEPGRDRLEGLENDLAALVPADLLVVGADDGHPVVVGESLDPQQLGLGPIPASRQVVAAADRLDQRLNGFVGRLVGEVAGGQPVWIGAQAVHGRLLLQQCVEGIGARPQPGLQGCSHRLGDRPPPLPVRIEEAGKRDVECDRLVALRKLDSDRGRELVEQPAPGPATGQ